MSERLKAAQAALNEGRRADAIENLKAALTENPRLTVQVYRALVVQLYHEGQYEEGVEWAKRGIALYPRDDDLMNTWGVLLRRLQRYPEAVEILNRAIKLNPKSEGALSNKANVLLDMGDGAKAEPIVALLARKSPRNSEFQRQLGRALNFQGKREAAIVRFRQAVSLKKENIDAWLDLTGTLSDLQKFEESSAEIDRALAANPTALKLMEAKAVTTRRSGRLRETEAYLQTLLPQYENEPWLQYQLGSVISDYDRDRGNFHMRRAIELDPTKTDYKMALIESLERTRSGTEGANLDEAYRLLKETLETKAELGAGHKKVATELLIRVGAFEEAEGLGDVRQLGQEWGNGRLHTALLKLLSRVRSTEDRLSVVDAHRAWGKGVEAQAKREPIAKLPPRPADGRIRLGFMSSDLRRHPVAYFALPLFDHIDPRFDVYCYSFYQGREDDLQRHIATNVTAFRWIQDISARGAAQIMADDQLDMIIELGGSTHMNKLDAMAYRAAPVQASWLGYPHSAGLSTIDYLILDPYVAPKDSGSLMIEKPLLMPSTWIGMGKLAFPEVEILSAPPVERNGFVTYGTANNSYKYAPDMLRVWAQIVSRTPNSKFLFLRPEGGSELFRRSICAYFEAEGVSADRVLFEPVRGAHLPHYNRIDVALDTFPQTGGTTTCEALWMGVPTVSLVGPTIFERLSYSILMNAGLGDLCVETVDDYVEKALELANDRTRIADLRLNMRERLKATPLGRTDDFARDFYEMIAGAVKRHQSAVSAR